MINLQVKQQTLLKHIHQYFDTSLQYFPNQYLGRFLKDGDEIPIHTFYLCPLCLSNFILATRNKQQDGSLRDLLETTSEFSLDHFPPESVGGRKSVLVCKACNNESGHDFDHEVKKHIQHLSLQKGAFSTKVDVKHTIEGVGKFNGKLESNENNEWIFYLKKRQTDKIKPLDEWLEKKSRNNDFTINITIPTPKDEEFQKAMLKTAYLYCFAHFGYEFAFSTAGNLIRKVLNGEEEYPIRVTLLQFEKHNQKDFNNIPEGVCYILQPVSLRSFVVNIKVKYKENGYEAIHSVFISNPTETGIEDLKKIPPAIQAKDKIDVQMNHLNNILHSTPFAYLQTWMQMQEQVK